MVAAGGSGLGRKSLSAGSCLHSYHNIIPMERYSENPTINDASALVFAAGRADDYNWGALFGNQAQSWSDGFTTLISLSDSYCKFLAIRNGDWEVHTRKLA